MDPVAGAANVLALAELESNWVETIGVHDDERARGQNRRGAAFSEWMAKLNYLAEALKRHPFEILSVPVLQSRSVADTHA